MCRSAGPGTRTQDAFSELLSHTSTEWAPWHVIPADRKWFARLGAGAVLVHALMELDPRYPAVNKRQRQLLLEAKKALEAQAPRGVARDPLDREQTAGETSPPTSASAEPAAAS